MYFLNDKIEFPLVSEASSEGLLAIGGDLSTERLIHAYRNGIFPWFEDDEPLLWWSPDPRGILELEHFHVSKSLLKTLKYVNQCTCPYKVALLKS